MGEEFLESERNFLKVKEYYHNILDSFYKKSLLRGRLLFFKKINFDKPIKGSRAKFYGIKDNKLLFNKRMADSYIQGEGYYDKGGVIFNCKVKLVSFLFKKDR